MEALTGVEYPSMRDEILAAIEALSDTAYQKRVWVDRMMPTPRSIDNFDSAIHRLYDDTRACTDPADCVPSVLYADEVQHLVALSEALNELLDDPDLNSDEDFISDHRWPLVVDIAQTTLTTMARNGDGIGSRNVIWKDEP